MARFFSDARRGSSAAVGSSELMVALSAEQPHLGSNRYGTPEDPNAEALCEHTAECLRRAVELLERKATAEEVEDYRRFVLGVAQAVAEAHKEGSFLGIGGTRVSPKEQAAIDEIAGSLGAKRA